MGAPTESTATVPADVDLSEIEPVAAALTFQGISLDVAQTDEFKSAFANSMADTLGINRDYVLVLSVAAGRRRRLETGVVILFAIQPAGAYMLQQSGIDADAVGSEIADAVDTVVANPSGDFRQVLVDNGIDPEALSVEAETDQAAIANEFGDLDALIADATATTAAATTAAATTEEEDDSSSDPDVEDVIEVAKDMTAAIAGGTSGGVVGLLLIVGLIYWWRKKQSSGGDDGDVARV